MSTSSSMSSLKDVRSSTIYVDPSGDLRLVAGYTDAEGDDSDSRTFVVSTRVLCLASPIWKSMFDPSGPWAKQKSGSEPFEMKEDDPDTLLILLDAAHLNFDLIPQMLDLDQLFQLAVLCDKYDTFKLVRPWISGWITWLQGLKPTCAPGNEDWLFISWSFGKEKIYQTLSKHLVSSVTINEEGQCLGPAGKILGDDMPPGALQSIISARKATISALVKHCTTFVDLLVYQTHVCKEFKTGLSGSSNSDEAKECDALVLGSLIKGLFNCGLWPISLIPDDSRMSVTTLKQKLLEIQCLRKRVMPQTLSTGATSTGTLFGQALPSNAAPYPPTSSVFGQPRNPPPAFGASPTPNPTPTPIPPSNPSGQPTFSTFGSTPVRVENHTPHERCNFVDFRAEVNAIIDKMSSGVLDEHREHIAEREKKYSTVVTRD